jgi:putative transposase
MAARPRLIYPDIAVHIVQRGHDRNPCFKCDADYLAYLGHLRHLLRRYGCQLHAYCLMTNHVHLLVTPKSARACGGLMRDLGRSYVRYFNNRHERSGTLWESRYRSCLVESARYVLACYRYIELNPVRAGMVTVPGAYPWSSHRTNSGTDEDASILAHAEYLALGRDPSTRTAAYLGLFDEGMDRELLESIREATFAGYPLASDAFKDTLLAQTGWQLGPRKPGPKITTLSRN